MKENTIAGGKKNSELPWGKETSRRTKFYCINEECIQHHKDHQSTEIHGFFSKSGPNQNGTTCGLCGGKRRDIVTNKSNSTDNMTKEKKNKCSICYNVGHNKKSCPRVCKECIK